MKRSLQMNYNLLYVHYDSVASHFMMAFLLASFISLKPQFDESQEIVCGRWQMTLVNCFMFANSSIYSKFCVNRTFQCTKFDGN